MWDNLKRWVFVPVALLMGLFGWIFYLLAERRSLEDELKAAERENKYKEINNGLNEAHKETESKLETYQRLRDKYLADDDDPNNGTGGHA